MKWRQEGFLAVFLGMALTSCAQLTPRQSDSGVLVTEDLEEALRALVPA